MIDNVYYVLLRAYLSIFDEPEATSLLKILPKNTNFTPDIIEFNAPSQWVNDLHESFVNISKMYPHVRTCTNSSNRIAMPRINTSEGYHPKYPAQVRWPGEDNSNTSSLIEEDLAPPLKITDFEYTYPLSRFRETYDKGNYGDWILDTTSKFLALQFDRAITATIIPKDVNHIHSIIADSSLFGHESNDMRTVGGYIKARAKTIEDLNPSFIKNALFHFRREYRLRAKWYMNHATARALLKLKDDSGNSLFDDSDRKKLSDDGIPQRLLGAPIIINDHMPSTGMIIVLADLSRGYVASKKPENVRIIVDISNKNIIVKFQMSGNILQPAAFKGVKFIPLTEDDIILDPNELTY